MILAAQLFKEMRDQAIDDEKRSLYDALFKMASNIEEIRQYIRKIKDNVAYLSSR